MMAQPLEPRLSRLEGAFEQIVERLGDTNARLETLDQKMELNFHALLTTMDTRFTAIDSRFAAIDTRFAAIDTRFAEIDTRFAGIDTRFTALDTRFSAMERKLIAMDGKFTAMDDKFETKFAALDRKIDSRFQFLIGAYVTTTVALGGIFFAAIAPLYTHLAR